MSNKEQTPAGQVEGILCDYAAGYIDDRTESDLAAEIVALVRAAAWQEFSEAIWSEETLQKAGMMGQGITRTEWSGMTEKEQGRVRQIAGWYIGPALTIIAPEEASHE